MTPWRVRCWDRAACRAALPRMSFRPRQRSQWRRDRAAPVLPPEAPLAATLARPALIEPALAEYRQRLETELPDDTAPLDEMETTVARIQQESSRDLQRR